MYTAKEINRMSIDQLESLACMLTEDQRITWSCAGYDGETYVKLISQTK